MTPAVGLRIRVVAGTCAILLLAGCAPTSVAPPPAPPSVEDAQTLLREIIEAGIAKEWDRLCANATGTCESELEGNQERSPRGPSRVDGVEVHHGSSSGGESNPGGVLFVLCGEDGLGEAYESEVFVFNDGDGLLATAAVYWVGTRVSVSLPPITTGADGAARC